MQIKKGDKVTMISGHDNDGVFSVRHYTVSSWGKKQATLMKTDGSNAEFRVYTADITKMHGVRSSMIVHTAYYTEQMALDFAVAAVAHQRALDNHRYWWVSAKMEPKYWTQDREDFERMIWVRALATDLQVGVVSL